MRNNERGIVFDREFDLTIGTVIEAFLHEGFSIAPVERTELRRQPTNDDTLRYVELRASLPELTFAAARLGVGSTAILECRIAVSELIGSCTLVTTAAPVVDYPRLASLVPSLTDRSAKVLAQLTRAVDAVAA
jgi:hypothetical protein